MTPDEIQALREKHRDNGIDGRCETCHYPLEINGLEFCTAPDYPCDVIKVLDAYEADRVRFPSFPYDRENCGHFTGFPYDGKIQKFTYCPVCGEKL